MYFLGKLKTLFIASLFIIFNIQNSNTIENKILFKIDNEIITTIDIYEEIKFLRTFTPEINDLEDAELFEISKNSILRDRIKKIGILEFVEELKVQDKFLLNLIKNKYSKTNIDTLEDFRIYFIIFCKNYL